MYILYIYIYIYIYDQIVHCNPWFNLFIIYNSLSNQESEMNKTTVSTNSLLQKTKGKKKIKIEINKTKKAKTEC